MNAQASKKRTRSSPTPARVLVPALLVLSGIVAILSVAGVLIVLDFLVGRPETEQLNAVEIFALMAGFVVGASVVGGLLVLAAALRSLRTLENSLGRVAQHLTDSALPNGRPGNASRSHPTAQVSQPALDEMLVFMRDLRDNSLLSDAQKQAKRERLAKQERDALAGNVETLVAKGEFHQATLLVADLESRFGSDPETRKLTREIERVRRQTEQSDVEAVTRRIEDLLGISAWPRAEEIANNLITRHPDSAEARKLANRIQRERHQAEELKRQTELANVQRLTNRREWIHALGAAQQFIEKYPDCHDTEVLHTQIETLQANAEIEERTRLEGRIKESIRLGKFDEAIKLARKVIDEYPKSPQAEVLKSQLPRLEERAAAAAGTA